MIKKIMETEICRGMDFSYLKKEIYNLKPVPRPFDEKMYRKYGVSDTVISYWKEIGFTPAYYHLFWLVVNKKAGSYEEWMVDKTALVQGILQENRILGEAVSIYCKAEQRTLDWMMASDRDYAYLLKDSCDDGAEEIVVISSDIDAIMERMWKEISEDMEDEHPLNRNYYIDRFRIDADKNRWLSIDLEHACGRLEYDSKGVLTDMYDVKGFDFDDGAIDLLSPYIFLPHPFKKGDGVSYLYGDERIFGVLSYPCDNDRTEDAQNPDNRELDSSSFTATVETIHEIENEHRFIIGHDHICPLYLDKAETNFVDAEGPNPSMLSVMHQIITGKSASLNELSYFMR